MSMTLGKDVSALFPDVLKNIATADLDQKKLVYLYLMYVGDFRDWLFLLTKCKELREIASRPLYSRREYVCPRLRRPQPFDPSAGYTNNGLYPCG